LTITTNGKKYIKKDGETTITPRTRYVCYNKTRHPELCNGQTGYSVRKLDAIAEALLHSVFEKISDNPGEDHIQKRYEELLEERKANFKRAKELFEKCAGELSEYEAEVINVIRGQSKFSPELINKLQAEAAVKTQEARQNMEHCEAELQNSQELFTDLQQQFDDIVTWAQMYEDCSMDSKKMIANHMIKSVRANRDYELDIELNISCEQFGLTM
jgi:exonuclease VII small subunit